MKETKSKILPFIIAISALSVSASAAFYSVSGLSKLFAGASVEVMVMASSLEVAKLVVASLLYRYWDDLNKLLRTYLVVAVTVLILITSMGIYGFLSAAYQETYNKVSVREAQKDYIQQEIDFYQQDVNRHERELEIIANNIATLSSTRSSSIQVKDTAVRGGYRTTISTSEVRLAQKRIVTEEENRKTIQAKRDKQVDSLQKYQLEILELNNSTDLAGELGPLQYLSNLTGTPMDSIINILLLIIVFVFDPLAIALVIAANFAFKQAKLNTLNKIKEESNSSPQDGLGFDPWEEVKEEFEPINENEFDSTLYDGLEYEPWNEFKEEDELSIQKELAPQQEFNKLDTNKDGIIDENEKQIAKNRINEIENTLNAQSISSWKASKLRREVENLKSTIPKDDNIIDYN